MSKLLLLLRRVTYIFMIPSIGFVLSKCCFFLSLIIKNGAFFFTHRLTLDIIVMHYVYISRPKNWKDLINDEFFTRQDIIVLQDPAAPEKQNFAQFHHVQNRLKVVSEGIY